MADALSDIFISGYFKSKKDPKRDWMKIAEQAGSHLYPIVCEEFAHPEVALCALIHSLAEVSLCQQEEGKREKLLKAIPDAVRACIEQLEKHDSEEPYEYEAAETAEVEEEQEEQEELDSESGKDPQTSFSPNGPPGGPSQDGLPGGDLEDYEEEDDDPDQSQFRHGGPASQAGFKKRRRGT